jgi:hypothetical protein
MDKRRPLTTFLLELLANDPEWAAHVASLSPRTSLRQAVEDYLRFLKARVALTPEEIATADRILAMMAERGYDTPDRMAEAIETGEVSLAAFSRGTRVSAKKPRLDLGGA